MKAIMNNTAFWGDLEEKNILSMQAVFSNGAFSWISNCNYNCLVQVDEATNSIIRTESFIGESLDVTPLHKGVVLYKNKLFFYPNQGKGLNIVDINSGEQDYMPLEAYVVKERCCRFSTAILKGDILWLIPQTFKQQLLKVDLKKGEVSTQLWWEEGLKSCGVPSGSILFGSECSDNKLLVSVRDNDFFLRCSLEEGCMERVNLGMDNIGLHRVFDIDGLVWCTCHKSRSIYAVSYEGSICKTILRETDECEEAPYIRIIPCNNKVIVIPKCNNRVLVFNVNGERIAEINLSYRIGIKNKDRTICNYAFDRTDNGLILYPNYDGTVKLIDLEKFTVEEHEYNGRDVLHDYYLKHILPLRAEKEIIAKGYINENAEKFSLNEFIKFVEGSDEKYGNADEKGQSEGLSKSCAKRIMEVLKG